MLEFVDIADLDQWPEHHDQVLGWLRREWDDSEVPFSGTVTPADDRPGAKIALLTQKPVGVLAFKRHDLSETATHKLWINAVYVAPEKRRSGVARKLIRAAQQVAIPDYAEELYAYTEVPALYEKLGWKCLAYDGRYKSYTLVWCS